ncbi:hypothetical protein JCM31598_15300 [Desulfonatronum parangueonense]
MHRFRPENADGVAECFRETYGDSYPLTDCYDPRRIIELNRSGNQIAAVAVEDRTGEVVGHCSVQRRYPWAAGECGQIVVKRGHQGRSLAVRMGRFLEMEALEAGLVCLVSYEVTSHHATQLIAHRAKFSPCGLILGAMPATLNFQAMAGLVCQRESCMVSLKYLVPPKPVAIRVPDRHKDMIAKIYAGLGKPVVFQSPAMCSGPGETMARISQTWGTADILVRRIGDNTPREINAHLRDILAQGIAEVIYLEIPLDQSGGEMVCREAELAGFFFAGLGPSSTGAGEALILQYLNTQLDLSRPKVVTPLGKEILVYVAQQRWRVHEQGISG